MDVYHTAYGQGSVINESGNETIVKFYTDGVTRTVNEASLRRVIND